MTTRALLALIVALVATTACAVDSDFQPVQFQAYSPSSDSNIHAGPDRSMRTAVQSPGEWKKLWAEIEPHLAHEGDQSAPHPLPSIDFSKFTLVVAAMGEMPSSGYFVAIQSIIESRWDLRVTVVEVEPSGNCMVLPATTHPVALVLVPRTTKPFSFDVIRSESKCE